MTALPEPCPYPDCKDYRAHSSPHLIEAAAIEKRIKKEVERALDGAHTCFCNNPTDDDFHLRPFD